MSNLDLTEAIRGSPKSLQANTGTLSILDNEIFFVGSFQFVFRMLYNPIYQWRSEM